jgi:hypothetical protein
LARQQKPGSANPEFGPLYAQTSPLFRERMKGVISQKGGLRRNPIAPSTMSTLVSPL